MWDVRRGPLAREAAAVAGASVDVWMCGPVDVCTVRGLRPPPPLDGQQRVRVKILYVAHTAFPKNRMRWREWTVLTGREHEVLHTQPSYPNAIRVSIWSIDTRSEWSVSGGR